MCGVHIYNQGSQLNPDIKQWDVKVLMVRLIVVAELFSLIAERQACCYMQIHPDKRHLDKVAAKEFWRYLFAFIKLKLQ